MVANDAINHNNITLHNVVMQAEKYLFLTCVSQQTPDVDPMVI